MSFFKDFKDDLSQAVNELMPGEASAAPEEAPQMVDTITEPAAAAPAEAAPQSEADELASLLATLDMDVVNEAAAESAPSAPIDIPVYTETVSPVAEEVKAPVEPIFAPDPAPIAEEVKAPVEPIFAPDPAPVAEEVKTPVAPVFSETPAYSAPINTTVGVSANVGSIPEGMTVTGDIESDGSLDVMGTVKGNITVAGKLNVTGNIEGNSKANEVFADGAKIVGEIVSLGSVKVGNSTIIKGNITATSAVLAGAIKGDIDVKGPVILDSTAIIMGNIKSKSIQINNGAAIEGLCSQCYADVSPVSFFTEE